MVQLKYCPFLSINEVDIYLAYKYFVWSDNTKQPAFLQCRKQLAHLLIYNNHIKKDDDELTPTRKSKWQRPTIGHHKETAPLDAMIFVASRW